MVAAVAGAAGRAFRRPEISFGIIRLAAAGIAKVAAAVAGAAGRAFCGPEISFGTIRLGPAGEAVGAAAGSAEAALTWRRQGRLAEGGEGTVAEAATKALALAL